MRCSSVLKMDNVFEIVIGIRSYQYSIRVLLELGIIRGLGIYYYSEVLLKYARLRGSYPSLKLLHCGKF